MKISKQTIYACGGGIPNESDLNDRSMEADNNLSKDEDSPVNVAHY
jgi:hypothetical protein